MQFNCINNYKRLTIKKIKNITLLNFMEEKKVISKICQIRASKGFTKKEVAAKINLSEATYGRIESEIIALSYSHLARIASAFDMTVVDLLTYNDSHLKDNKTPRVTLQIDLEDNVKADVIKLAFGDRVLEIKNNDNLIINK